jgi:porin
VPTKSGNWLVTLNVEQYLWKPKSAGGAKPAARTFCKPFAYQEPGVGLYFRFGYTPEDRNPWHISVSGGLSGRGVIPGRPYDRLGFGVYGLIGSGDLEDQVIIGDFVTDEVGIEAFYNFAITPWLQVSADIQWVAPGIASYDDAVVLGTRIFTQF